MRINARLDDKYEQKFHQLQMLENKNRTEVLKEALDFYFSAKLNQKEHMALEQNRKILEMIGGIDSSAPNLSENYKSMVYQGLKDKHDIS